MADIQKTLRFSAKLDTQEFDKTVDALQRKLKDIYKGSEQSRLSYQNQERMGRIGIGPGVSPADRTRMDQADARTRRETDQFIKQQIKDQEKLAKSINSQVEEMKKLQQVQRQLNRDSEEYAKNQQKIAQIEKQTAMDREMIRAKENAVGSALDQRDQLGNGGFGRLRTAYQRGGFGGLARAGQRMGGSWWGGLGGLGQAGVIGSLLAAAGNTVGQGISAYGGYQGLPFDISQGRGAAASVYNQDLQRMFEGRGYEDMFFAQERKRAEREATAKTAGERKKEVGGLISGGSLSAGAGAAAALGAAALIIGTGGLALLPALAVGAAGAAAGAGAYGVAKHRDILGVMGVGQFGQAKDAEYEARRAEFFQQSLEAQKQLDPMKKLAFQDFQHNMAQNLTMERAVGFRDTDLFNFNDQITRAGFTRGMGREAAQNILSAGGTTRGARETAGLSLQMQRNFDLTNANQVLGKLTGVAGSGASAERALIGILAAGTKEGLDKSEFAEENRKFTQSVADIVYRTGASDPMAAAQIAMRESGFLAARTTRGLEAAKNASQFVSGVEKQGTGMGSVLEMGGMLGNKNLARLDPMAMAAVQGMSMEEIMALPEPMKRSLTRRAGFNSFEEFMGAVAPTKDIKLTGQMPQLFESVQKARDVYNKGKMGPLSKEQQAAAEDAQSKVMESLMGTFGLAAPEAESVYRGLMERNEPITQSMLMKEVDKKKAEVSQKIQEPTGRAADVVTASAAANEAGVNELQRNFIPQIGRAASNVSDFADEVKRAMEKIKEAGGKGDSAAVVEELKKLNANITSRGLGDQAGKDASGNPMVQTQASPSRGQ